MTTSQQKLLPWLSNLVSKTIYQGLPVLPGGPFYLQKILFVSLRSVRSVRIPALPSFFSVLLFSSLLFSSLLFCSLLFSVDFPDEKSRFPDGKYRFLGEKKSGGHNDKALSAPARLIERFSLSSIRRIPWKIDLEWSTQGKFF